MAQINPKLPTFWHGGDYNPDQWPDALRIDDVRLMKLAHVNVASVGIFSWSQLEPKHEQYNWDWLDDTFERLYKDGIYIDLATPTAAHPRWLTTMYPEIQAVDNHGNRLPHGGRQRFCPTSPIFREHVKRINTALAKRYGSHPGLVLWHVSNEYSGTSCWCDKCVSQFRFWLQQRYGSLEVLNEQWWTAFWSHRFSDWSEIIPPYVECGVVPESLILDWRRFQSHQVCQFFKFEVETLRAVTPDMPVSTNLMGIYSGTDANKFADCMDVIAWDSYPLTTTNPGHTAFTHALMRGAKGNKPWILMEQTPSATNWQEFATLKQPGLMRLQSWQAIGHGSDGAMYFQWRRSRGGHEKFHGAVVAHAGHEHTRVFGEVAELGREMSELGPQIAGTTVTKARVGVLWDQENRWALEFTTGPGRYRNFIETMNKHFTTAWGLHVPIDVVRMDADWTQYDVLIAPMLYMVKSGQFPIQAVPEELITKIDEGAKIAAWVEHGGTFVTTYLSGMANESGLVYEGGYPGPLRKTLGIWAEEIDNSAPGQATNSIVIGDNPLGLECSYSSDTYFDLLHLEGATAIATYGENWYSGRPCVTRNVSGSGLGYYIATDASAQFLTDFYRAVLTEKGITPLVTADDDVEVLERVGDDGRRILFLLNHARKTERTVEMQGLCGTEMLSGARVSGIVTLAPLDVKVILLEG